MPFKSKKGSKFKRSREIIAVLTKYGLEVARYDNNVTQEDSMFRKTPFTVNNINSANILKMSPLKLNILNKDFYDNITTIM